MWNSTDHHFVGEGDDMNSKLHDALLLRAHLPKQADDITPCAVRVGPNLRVADNRAAGGRNGAGVQEGDCVQAVLPVAIGGWKRPASRAQCHQRLGLGIKLELTDRSMNKAWIRSDSICAHNLDGVEKRT